MDSDIGTLLFVTSLLGAGGLGIYYYGSESNLFEGGSENDNDDDNTNFRGEELEELDDNYFTPNSGRVKRLNNINNRSKKSGRRVRFNTRRRY